MPKYELLLLNVSLVSVQVQVFVDVKVMKTCTLLSIYCYGVSESLDVGFYQTRHTWNFVSVYISIMRCSVLLAHIECSVSYAIVKIVTTSLGRATCNSAALVLLYSILCCKWSWLSPTAQLYPCSNILLQQKQQILRLLAKCTLSYPSNPNPQD